MRIFAAGFGGMDFFHFSFKNLPRLRIVKNLRRKRPRIVQNIGYKGKYRCFCFNADLDNRTVFEQIISLHGMNRSQLQRGQIILRRSFGFVISHLSV